MKNLKRSFLALLLILTLIVSSIVPVSAATTTSGSQPTQYSSEYNSGTRGVVCTTLDGTSASSYYTNSYTYDRLDDLSGDTLKTTLKTLMKSTHTYTSSYNDCHYKADRTDCQNEDGSVVLIYTSYAATMSQWNGWNREHVWPQSLGGGNTSGGGADLHHIRPSDAGVNSSRGNKKYGEAGDNASSKTGTNPAVGVLGGYYNSTYFEPLDEVKGDVARICLYVYVRWGSEWGADSITEVFQSVDVLLEWCELDPVDTWEMGRNEVIQDIQGNRNVFIDYPELAWLLFNREVPEGMTSPSAGMGNNSGSGSGSGSTTPSVCQHTSTEIRGVIAVTCTTAGYTGDTYCKTCNTKISDGQSIPATGHNNTVIKNQITANCGTDGYTGDTYCNDCKTTVSYGETIPKTESHTWKQTVADGVTTRTCIHCGEVEIRGGDNCSHSGTRTVNKVTATCTTEGYTGDKVCGYCGVTVSYGTVIPTTDHTWGDWVGSGEGEETRTCTKCDETETRDVEVTCQHTETVMSGYIEATCTYEGYTGDVHCYYCYELLEAGHATPMIDHEWSDWTDNGDGFETRACDSCGDTESREASNTPCPHNDTVRIDAVDATCTYEGYTGDWYCNDCGEVTGTGSVIPSLVHAWGAPEITKEPTATENGEQRVSCANCDEVLITVIPATGEQTPDEPEIPEEPEMNDADVIVSILVTHLLETILWNLLA